MPLVVDGTGITTQPLEEIVTELHAATRRPSPDGWGPDFVIDEREPIPMVLTIAGEREANVQAALLVLKGMLTPGEARGIFADDIAALTGTRRLDGSRSTVPALLTGTALATIPTGRVYMHTPTGTLWDQLVDVELDGAGEGTLTLRAQVDGPIDVSASTNWSIVIGHADLLTVESTSTSTLGRLRELDPELEERRVDQLGRSGSCTHPAIRADVLERLSAPPPEGLGYDVDAVEAFVNFRHVFDSEGRPPGSVEVLLDDNGLIPDEVVAQVIWDIGVGCGIEPWGNVYATITDSSGTEQDVGFSRAVDVPIYLRLTIDRTGAEEPIGDLPAMATAISAKVATWGTARHRSGRDVAPQAAAGAAFDTAPYGSIITVVVEVSDDGVAWSTAAYSINARQTATFDPSRVTVVWA